MRLKEFMTRDVEVISVDESLETALQLMKRHRIHHLVAMAGNQVVGVISERDLGRLDRPEEREHLRVSDVMSRHVAIAEPESTLREAANLMRGRTIGCLPVLEEGKLVGIVTTTDILDLLGQGIERIIGDRSQQYRENPARHPSPGLPSQF